MEGVGWLIPGDMGKTWVIGCLEWRNRGPPGSLQASPDPTCGKRSSGWFIKVGDAGFPGSGLLPELSGLLHHALCCPGCVQHRCFPLDYLLQVNCTELNSRRKYFFVETSWLQLILYDVSEFQEEFFRKGKSLCEPVFGVKLADLDHTLGMGWTHASGTSPPCVAGLCLRLACS